MTTCFNPIRRTASATRCGSSSSSANGLAVLTAQNPQARVQRSPPIIIVAVPWLQHSQRFGHWALSQTVWRRRSEMRALVEKKTGLEGNRTLIQGGFCAWCKVGSSFVHGMMRKANRSRADFQSPNYADDGHNFACVLECAGAPPLSDGPHMTGQSL